MAKQRSAKSCLTPSMGNLPNMEDVGSRRRKRLRPDSGVSGGAPIPKLELTSLIGALEAIVSTARRQGSGSIPFQVFLPASLQRHESNLHEPGILRELLKHSIVIRTACTLSEGLRTGWLQVIFSIPRVSESGKLLPPEPMPPIGASNITASATSIAAATLPPARGK